MKHFNEAGLPQALLHRLENAGFTTPTPIQAETLPKALEGRDILGSAQTGTGKTGAYGIPLVSHLMSGHKGSALVLLPTRELATQVLKALKVFIGKEKLPTALLIGGEPMGRQLSDLRAKPRLIVGTPGRINDHLDRGSLMLHQVNFLVLDEVDRMLDMGFGVQLDAIAKFLTNKRQTLMFSATLPKNIEQIAAKYLTDPLRISVGSTRAPASKIKQEEVKIGDHEKYDRLLDELNGRDGSVIVFVKTKYAADKMAVKLKQFGHKSDALHGDLHQGKRNRVVTAFRNKQYRVLVATDVAARGLDIPHIEHVINYDLPQNPEDYIHRIGRTARAGADGEAINFISPADSGKWRAISRLLNPNAPEEPAERRGARKGGGRRRFGGGRTEGAGFKGKGRPSAGGRGGRSSQAKKNGPKKPDWHSKSNRSKKR